MDGKRYALIVAVALFVGFVALNLTANSWFRAARLDLTESRLYSLSDGTREILSPASLSEQIELKLFVSREAIAQAPDLQAYSARVREMLQSYAAAARGRIRFVEVDPEPFSEAEDEAVEAGIQAVPLREGGDPLYFGLVGSNAIDDKRAVPFFDIAREPFLEYELTRLIYELQSPEPNIVALISALPLDPSNPGQSAFAEELGRFARVERLPVDFSEIPADAGVLALIHPWPLTQAQQYAVDQFVLRKGRAFIALDPASMAAQQSGFNPLDPLAPTPTSSSLPALFAAWGVSMSQDVVLDGDNALDVQTQNAQGQPARAPQPLFFSIGPDGLAREDLMTAPLQRGINFGLAGALTYSEREGRSVTPLARTSGATMRMPAEQALMRPTPFDIMSTWTPAGRIETVAMRLSGPLQSAFVNGPPPEAALREGVQHLARSEAPVELVIVSDTDFLADDFYVDRERGASFADNGAFALNVIDILSGSQALVNLRARAQAARPMELVARMENEALMRIQQRQEALQQELADTEARLAELRGRGQASGYFAGDLGAELSPEERREIDRFTRRVTEVRQELRSVGRDLRANIDALKAVIVFVNMWLAPLLVAGAGLFIFWRRTRRVRAAAMKGRP